MLESGLKKKVAIAGCGRYLETVEKCLCENTEVIFYIDNAESNIGRIIKEKSVISPYEADYDETDYIVIAPFYYDGIYCQLLELGIDEKRILAFFDPDLDFTAYSDVFDVLKSINYSAKYSVARIRDDYEKKIKLMFSNMPYECYDYSKKHKIQMPVVRDVNETVEKIIRERCSVSRFGDGEMEIVAGHGGKDVYQEHDDGLSVRLREILLSNIPNHIVALADDYGCMEGLSEQTKDNIRSYMTAEKREEHYKYFDFSKTYYNAYISRPYVIYPWSDIDGARKRFDQLKRIWDGQNIVFVEGDKTRSGVGNDLFDNANSIRRILAPSEHAYRKYKEILETVHKVEKGTLVLIALGPTATVLAYDLSQEGYWAIDIGHLDLEYEWFIRGKGFSYIRNKYNNELSGDTRTVEETDDMYISSIIDRVD